MLISQAPDSLHLKCCIKLSQLVSSSLAMKWAHAILFKQKRTQIQQSGFTQYKLPVRNGVVTVYKMGTGVPIWLVPSTLNSRNSFVPLMKTLAKHDVATITFDFPASIYQPTGKFKLSAAVDCFDDIGDQLLQPKTIICHSISTSVLANSNWLKQYKGHINLVSPFFDYYAYVLACGKKLGIYTRNYSKLIATTKKKEKQKFKRDSTSAILEAYANRITVFHDKEDPCSTYSDSFAFTKRNRIKLISTIGLGHNRGLHSRKLTNHLIQQMQQY